jgi:hypothetical protein
MPRKSLLLLSPSFFLMVAPLAKADSINLTQLDSGQLVTLAGSDYRGQFVLTPNSILHLCILPPASEVPQKGGSA